MTSIQQIYENIAYFLRECVDNQWDLDVDDIEHILQSDFDYVRKSNTIAETFDNVDEATESLHREMKESSNEQ